MEAQSKTWFVIINPTSGNGKAKKKWPKIKTRLAHYKFNFEYAFTAHPKHSTELVQHAVNRKIYHIISVGGDGTLHNIVNGILLQSNVLSKQIKVGVIPIGTGNDWVKTHHIPKNIDKAIKIIKQGNTVSQDIGKIEFKSTLKQPVFFHNLAGMGFDGFVVSKIEKHKKLGAFAYLLGAVTSMFSFKNFDAIIHSNSEEIKGKILMVLVGLCKYSGGGMQLTQAPNPFDGLLDITIAGNLNKFDILKNLLNLFNGKITNHKKVKTLKATSVTMAVPQKAKPFIQADGELFNGDAITISVIPKAFTFYA